MKKQYLALFLLFITAGPMLAESLWTDAVSSLFIDHKARQVGDILNIIVSESAVASANAATKANKSESTSTPEGVGPILYWLPKWSISGETGMDASGSTSRSDSLQARIAVTVKEVRPNGNLVIEGTRIVTINKEQRKLILSGVVRPEDVTPRDTVLSSLVADAQINYDGKGPLGNKQREGIITRIFNWLF